MSSEALRLFWFIQTYKDLPRLRRTLSALRTLYPEAQVLVVSDGDPNPAIARACADCSVDFVLRSRLIGVEHGGEPVQKMLEAFLARDADILIKIDPDTNVKRRFSIMPSPSDSSIFGTVQTAGPESNRIVSIQGGCIIVPRAAAARLASSSLLQSDRLKPPALEWVANRPSLIRARSGLTSYDWSLGWACRALGLQPQDHPEVFSRYRPSLMDLLTERQAAVCHPRFEWRQLAMQDFYFSGLRAALSDAMRTDYD
jgi:hypothetical protein